MNTRIEVDTRQPVGKFTPIWRFFGADEPNYAYMPDGQRLLGELGQLGPRGGVYFRAHNLLTSGDGTPALKWGSTNAYTEDAQGRPVYDWTILDRIFDTYLKQGLRPFAQIGFMPRALSTHPDPYQHAWHPGVKYEEIMTGWAHPPKDYDKWRELCFQWASHCVERHGRAEVEQWYWEVWNEANGHYWKSTCEEFHKLHDYAIDGIRRALPTARVGGPHSAGSGGQWTRDFFEHCLRGRNYASGQVGTPLDFVAFHAKGSPSFVDGHVRMGIANHLRAIDEGFRLVGGYPELKKTPIVIGESDPDGCAACQGPQLGYRNGTMYSSYTAASFARKWQLADRHGVHLAGALTWAFEFEDQPLFAGFRVLSSNGLDLPVLNVFRMFALMSGDRVKVVSSGERPLEQILHDGVRKEPDIAALATTDGGNVAVMVWHYHDDDIPGPDAAVDLSLAGVTAKEYRVTHYRIDADHANAFTAWHRIGSPLKPTAQQLTQLSAAGRLAVTSQSLMKVEQNAAHLSLQLPRQAVELIVLKPS